LYICLDCGQVFNRPYVSRETHYEVDGNPTETFDLCPSCFSSDIEEADVCAICGVYIGESQAKYHLCPECEQAAEEKFKQVLKEGFTEEEIEFLNNQYEGRYFGI
jgi:hypothetical protein